MRFLHACSGFFFYLLGASAFAAYVLWRNALQSDIALWWLQVVDMPLGAAALIYGSTSLLISVSRPGERSVGLGLLIAFPAVLILLALIALNFWPLIETTL